MKSRLFKHFHLIFAVLSLLAIILAMILLNQPTSLQPYTIGIIIANEDRYEKVAGIKVGMEELGFLENRDVQYITYNLQGKRTPDEALFRSVQHQMVDLIMTTGAWETQMATQLIPDTPIVFAGVASPNELGLISQPWISGVDNGQIRLIGKRLELIKYWIPTVKKIMVIADSNAPTTPKALEEVQKSAHQLQVQTEVLPIGSKEELKTVIEQTNPGQYDALLPLPSFLLEDSITDLVPLLVEKRLFTMGSYPEQVERGLFASYGISFFEQGKQASRLAAKILDGRRPSIPYEIPDSIKISIHKTNMNKLGIQLTNQQTTLVHQFFREVDE